MSRELLKRIQKFSQENYPVQMNGLVAEIEVELNRPEPEPDYWHVVDEEGNSIYSASFKEACHDHIKDAQLSDDTYFAVDIASKWIVRPLWSKPPVSQEPLTDVEIIKLWVGSGSGSGSDTVRPVLGKNKVLRFARDIEQKVRGENDRTK